MQPPRDAVNPRIPSLLLASLGLMGALGPAAAQGDPPSTPEGRPVEAAFPRSTAWEQLSVRDARVGFPTSAGEAAFSMLSEGTPPESERALAFLAIGASKFERGRPMLQSWALEGSAAERRAAVLGLGEMGAPDLDLLTPLAEGPDGALAGAALTALLRSADPVARAYVERRASDGGNAGDRSELAADLLLYWADPEAAAPLGPVEELYELRWLAARRYGLIDGMGYRQALLASIGRDPAFLDAFVLRSAAKLSRAGVDDHFTELLLHGTGTERVRGATAAMPERVAQLILTELWVPANTPEWNALLETIDVMGSERIFVDVLRAARLLPDQGTFAAGLLVQAGDRDGLPLLELDLASTDPVIRRQVVEALADSGIRRYVTDLEELREDEDADVRAAALVGQVRLGHETAKLELDALLYGEVSDERARAVDALARVVHDPASRAILAGVEPALDEGPRDRAAVALASAGRLGDVRERARGLLISRPESIKDGPALVRGLSRGHDPADIETFRAIFPVPDRFDLNVALATALAESGDTTTLALLQYAVWHGEWNRSCLAAATLVERDGMKALRAELARPPIGVAERDLRRVGYALGELGGMDEVERLSERRSSGDPVLQGAVLGALASRTF